MNIDYWKIHALKHHENLLDFKCKLCGKDFATVTELNRHYEEKISENQAYEKKKDNPRQVNKLQISSHGVFPKPAKNNSKEM